MLSSTELAAVKQVDGDVGAVRQILADLARREVDMTRDRTSVFVKSVIEYMGESTNLKDNPDRSAAFVVIKSAKVPSILIELGYVTNEADAELLKSEAWREKVSGSIVTAIDNYFSHQARAPADVTACRPGCRWPGCSGPRSRRPWLKRGPRTSRLPGSYPRDCLFLCHCMLSCYLSLSKQALRGKRLWMGDVAESRRVVVTGMGVVTRSARRSPSSGRA